jgi:Amt family ammonium transporter
MVTQLNLLQKRFMVNIKNPTLRFNVAVRMAGKMIGLLMVVALMATFIPKVVHASGLADGPTPEINAINTVWVLIAAFLVFCMQVGFEMLEAGFARSREAVNILAEGIADTCICGITFWAWGFAFMFMSGTPLIGTSGFFPARLA